MTFEHFAKLYGAELSWNLAMTKCRARKDGREEHFESKPGVEPNALLQAQAWAKNPPSEPAKPTAPPVAGAASKTETKPKPATKRGD